MGVKDTVRALLDRLPDDCKLEEVIDQLCLLEARAGTTRRWRRSRMRSAANSNVDSIGSTQKRNQTCRGASSWEPERRE